MNTTILLYVSRIALAPSHKGRGIYLENNFLSLF